MKNRAYLSLSAAAIIVVVQVACEVATLDLRGDGGPIDVPPPPAAACETAGHVCIAFEQTQGNELCPDDSQPFNDECERYNSPFGEALCCPKVELSDCELDGKRCFDGAFMSCPWAYEMRVDLSCEAQGRPVGKICCAPIPCEQAGHFCYVDPMFPGICPEGFEVQPLSCAESRDFGAPATCCSPPM